MESESDITGLRKEIDEIDSALLQLIAKRKDVALEIAKIKQTTGSKNDEERMKEVLSNIEREAKELGLDEEKVKDLWKELIDYMIEEQMKKHPY